MSDYYKLFATAKKTAKENNLIQAYGKYNYNSDYVYWDLSLLDSLKIPEDEKQMLIDDLIIHNSMNWYNQPLPSLAYNDWISYSGSQFKIHAIRIFNSKGKRIMVIVKIIEYHIEKRKKNDYYDRYYNEIVGTWEDKTYKYEHREEIEIGREYEYAS